MLISLILIGIVSSQIEIQGGKCLSVPIMPDFDLSKYSGTWYGQIRYPFRLDKPTDKCGSAEYTGINDTAIIANNTIIKLDEEGLYFKNEYIGTGVQLEPEIFPNSLYVCIVNCDDGVDPEAKYFVLDTDYENYTIVYTDCRDMGSYSIEQFWINSRTRDFRTRDPELYEEVVQKAVAFGFRRELATELIQEDCTYDYLYNEEQKPATTTNTTTTTTNSTTTTTATTTTSNLALYHALSLQLLVTIFYISI